MPVSPAVRRKVTGQRSGGIPLNLKPVSRMVASAIAVVRAEQGVRGVESFGGLVAVIIAAAGAHQLVSGQSATGIAQFAARASRAVTTAIAINRCYQVERGVVVGD